MKHSLRISTRILSAGLALLLAGHGAAAQSQPSYYSTFDTPLLSSEYAVGTTGAGACLGCFVANPERAADASRNNYATVQNSLGVLGGGVSLTLRLNGAGLQNYRAGVVISTGSVLNAAVLSTITLRTSLNGSPKQTVPASDLLQVSTRLLDADRYGLEFVANDAFDKIEIVVGGVVNGINTVRVLYAYAVPAAVQLKRAVGYISRSAQPAVGDFAVTYGGGAPLAVCVGSSVQAPENAVDADLTNYATLSTVAGVNDCSTALRVKLDGTALGSYHAGFVIGNDGLLDLNVLNDIQLTTYLNGTVRETRRGSDLLQLTLLADNRYYVSFRSGLSFDAVELKVNSLASVLNTLKAYYGFGIEPSAFRDQTPLLSSFADPQRDTEYQEAAGGLLCLGCSASNTAKAADNVFAPGNYAYVRFPVLALGTYKLKLRLNGQARAGNRAGIVLRTNNNLLNTTLLQNIRLTTYSGTGGGQQMETASGTDLLDLGLINDNRREVAFITKQNFEWVEVELTGGVGLFSDARIYYAFAEDPNPSFPAVVGPPVDDPASELRAGRGGNAGVVAVSAPLEAFPNPANGQQVEVGLAAVPAPGSFIRLYTMLGQQVRSVAATGRAVLMPLTDVRAGLYSLVLVDAQGRHLASQRLVVAQ